MSLTQEQINSFENEGYLLLDNVFTHEELNEFNIALKHIIKTKLEFVKKDGIDINLIDFENREVDEGMLMLEKINHTYVEDIYDIIPGLPEFNRIISKKEISQNVNQLLKRDKNKPFYNFLSRCRIDPPEGTIRTTTWHQEVFYSIPNSEFIQTWAPIIHDTTKKNGTIWICVKSHKQGILPQEKSDDESDPTFFHIKEETIKQFEQKQIEMKLGQLLIFSSRLVHKSGINVSNQVRYSIVNMYHNLDNKKFRPTRKIEK